MTGWGKDLTPELKNYAQAIAKVLSLYMPGTCEIEMAVGRNIKAKLIIEGGPLSREVIEDVMAHLGFYRKYFPKPGEPDSALTSPEKILAAFDAALAHHRECGASTLTADDTVGEQS